MAIFKRVIRRIRGRERLREETAPLLEETSSFKSSASEVVSVKSTPPIETPDSHDNTLFGHEQQQRQQRDIFDAVPVSPVSPLGGTNKPLPTVPSPPITRPNFIPASALHGVERPYVEDSNGRLSTPTWPNPPNNPSSSPPLHQHRIGRRPSILVNSGDARRPSIVVNTSRSSAGRSSIVINASNSDLDLILQALDSIRLDLTTRHSPHPNAAEIALLEPDSASLPASPTTSTMPQDQADRARQAGLEQLQHRRAANHSSPPLQLPPLDFQRPSLIEEVAERDWVTRQLQMQTQRAQQTPHSPVHNQGGIHNGIPHQPNGSTQTPPPPPPPQTPTLRLAEEVAEREWMERQVQQMNPRLPIPKRGSSLGTRILKKN